MSEIIRQKNSIIPACDVAYLEDLEKLVSETCSVEGIGAYKIGFGLALRYSLPVVCKVIRKITDLPIIYDHQKAATDIPETAKLFATVCKDAEVDAVILFPQSGPETEKSWIHECRAKKLGVIVGGEMTHSKYKLSDGGWIDDAGITKIYEIAKGEGVNDFVVPGNKPERIKYYADLLAKSKPVFYSPGLIAQGGEITESAKAAGERWHAIIGRGLYNSDNISKKAKELTSMLIRKRG